ncbi:MAG TPA: MBOAT family O-acyltransferase [Aliidongia sp.]|nr:MBOAT family O-acyltransferase [Aliidongia sp.]
MIYSSYEFLLFLPAFIVSFYSTRTVFGQNLLLLLGSIGFLVWAGVWNLLPVALVLAGVVLHWQIDARFKTGKLGFVVIISLLVMDLAYFKYRALLASVAGIHLPIPAVLVAVIPLGISFYTFEAISAVIDVRRRRLPVRGLDWPLFIMFFPHLIAGPIVRFRQLREQFDYRKSFRARNLTIGMHLFTIGFVKKLMADPLGQMIDPIWAAPTHASALALILAVLGFYVQLYLDFSGYTDMGRGVARMLGFRLPINFRAPFFAANPPEFYRRWHISLSNWIRIFLYDNMAMAVLRRIRSRKVQGRALMGVSLVVMALFGLWHGGAWHFMLFGVTQGVIIVTWAAVTKGKPPRTWAGKLFSILLLQLTWALSLLIFRANNLQEVGRVLRGFFRSTVSDHPPIGWFAAALLVTLVIQAIDYNVHKRPVARILSGLRTSTAGALVVTLAFLAALTVKGSIDFDELTTGRAGVSTAPFIYFNF